MLMARTLDYSQESKDHIPQGVKSQPGARKELYLSVHKGPIGQGREAVAYST
jgi:hypothetical protein